MTTWQSELPEETRRRPTVDVPAMYSRMDSVYPDEILIPMDDGRQIAYQIVILQPAPHNRRTEKSGRRGYPASGQAQQ